MLVSVVPAHVRRLPAVLERFSHFLGAIGYSRFSRSSAPLAERGGPRSPGAHWRRGRHRTLPSPSPSANPAGITEAHDLRPTAMDRFALYGRFRFWAHSRDFELSMGRRVELLAPQAAKRP